MWRSLILVAALSNFVGAEVWRLRTPSTVVTEGGSKISLPPAYCVDEGGWRRLDDELRKRGDEATRMRAERDSYAQEPKSAPIVIIGALILGLAAGAGAVWLAR